MELAFAVAVDAIRMEDEVIVRKKMSEKDKETENESKITRLTPKKKQPKKNK